MVFVGVYTRNLKACVIEVGGSAVARYGLMRWADEVPANRSDFQLLRDSHGLRRLSIPYSERPSNPYGQRSDGIKLDNPLKILPSKSTAYWTSALPALSPLIVDLHADLICGLLPFSFSISLCLLLDKARQRG